MSPAGSSEGAAREAATLRLVRRYPVAPAKVWRAWTDPVALARWWGPAEADTARCAELDLRVGGRYRIEFGAPDGSQHEAWGEYLELVPERLLVFSWNRRGLPEAQSQVRVELIALDDGTELRFEQAFASVAMRDDHEIGWLPTFAKLDALLRGTLA